MPSESLLLSFSELVFSRCVRDLYVVKERESGSRRSKTELLPDFVTRTRSLLQKAVELARDNLGMT